MSNLPICSNMPRLIPERPFPPYRYVNGLNPHPIKDPRGHSYGSQEPMYSQEYLDPDNWQQNKDYLYGIDLYHHGYFWESHEAWEGLWNAYGRETIPGKFMQGLIQNAAAQIKLHKKQLSGVCSLSKKSWANLTVVSDCLQRNDRNNFMGISITELFSEMKRCYKPFWNGTPNFSNVVIPILRIHNP
ncbi:DUF309 domain-containing protein [Candidatus Uabimicrobium amorphum]|uniref:DUF309 domain-containing protein n=1 Tax=Uabimicrobium amorphum TaxID=2596890 RepID=A0A5S9IRM7_UABAM|nr:DUF309 domain-containing protein [Candidatus Uabimicrobium amorphum]BBM86863.1 hypothetical protein UABAM_05263 [Candidatus Uabimicrobium amorphum]